MLYEEIVTTYYTSHYPPEEVRFRRRTTIASPTAGPDTGTLTYVDDTATPGTLYRYRVRAENLAGSSTWFNVAQITAL